MLETRRLDGMVKRRYELADGTRETTYELREDVVRWLGMRQVRRAIESTTRGSNLEKRSAKVREFVRQRMDWKPLAVAHELGITPGHVRRVRAQLIKEGVVGSNEQ